jgi:hypothetical protein
MQQFGKKEHSQLTRGRKEFANGKTVFLIQTDLFTFPDIVE